MNLLKQIETLFQSGTAAGLTDGQLLERFVTRQGDDAEAAFAALVERHGAMVLRVCRQVLGDEHDAQDASQAVFLVLARRAGSIGRRESVASWLHGVALRVAARARLASVRRRVRERRGGELMAARRDADDENGARLDPERCVEIHDELRRLPESFRDPLVLCYFEGLTHEQAAAQLRCPLGTIQSRLARGKARLKSRLTKRGFELSAIIPSTGPELPLSIAAPETWAEATVRLAIHFRQAKGSGTAAALAEEVLRAMLFTKLMVAVGTIMCAAALVSAAAAWARRQRGEPALVAMAADVRKGKPPARPAPRPQKAPEQPEWISRTVHGIVKDEQGHPVAKAWIGDVLARTPDRWEYIEPNRLRERKDPFIDPQGKLVPPGEVGKYFELRDEAGKWHPVHPADVRHAREDNGRPPRPGLPSSFGDPFSVPAADNFKAGSVYQVRKANGFFRMAPSSFGAIAADRTDLDGRFALEVSILTSFGQTTLHFASPDFSRQEIHAFGLNDPDRAVEIILQPLRAVRARVLAARPDEPLDSVVCRVFCVDSGHGILPDRPAIALPGIHWGSTELESTGVPGLSRDVRRLDLTLPAGRYKIAFESDTIYRIVDLVVPAGDGPLDLPEIRLDSLGWVKMLGQQAAEVEAVDLDGRPVKLAAYRGKVVVLAFFSAQFEEANQTVPLLTEVQRYFPGQPLAVLALHDATPASLAKFKKALEPLRAKIAGEIPIRFLLDRPTPADRSGLSTPRPGEPRSGRTMDIYEGPAMVVIDKNGKLVLAIARGWPEDAAFAIGRDGRRIRKDGEGDFVEDQGIDRTFTKKMLEDTLEDLFGLPRSVKPDPKVDRMPVLPKGPLVVSGKVIDLDGRPVTNARIEYKHLRDQAVESGPTGEFRFTLDDARYYVSVTVDAKGLAPRRFSLEFGPDGKKAEDSPTTVAIGPAGRIKEPLRMSPGVSVHGRLVRAGKPIGGVVVGLTYNDLEERLEIETQTDDHGFFQFPHVLPKTDFWAYAKAGGLPEEGALIPIWFRSGADGTSVDLGELHADRGHRMAGRLVCSDGKALPAGTRIVASFPNGGAPIYAILDAQQRFEFRGIPDGPVWLSVEPREGTATLGYRFSPRNKCRNPIQPRRIEGQLARDIADLTILLEPGTDSRFRFRDEIDPNVLADFRDAAAGPITGVPAGP